MIKKMKKDKRGVFGLNAVQAFFMIILSIALLAYVIVIVMGTLGGNTILSQSSASVSNESGHVNSTGYTLSLSTTIGFANPTITALVNLSDGTAMALGNATVSDAGVVTNATARNYQDVGIYYTYNFDSNHQKNLNSVLGNTSEGITGFFSSINPVYSILAILVIILVLIVLVRVVQNPNRSGSDQL